MPTLSASEYTQYLKFKAATATPIRPGIQTRDNVALSQSIINANLLTSQAAFVTTPSTIQVATSAGVVTAASRTTVTAARTNVLETAVGNGTVIEYTTNAARPHGLSNGTLITVTGFATFLAANVIDAAVTVVDSRTFRVTVAATGTATGSGSITGRVYYTTSVANGLVAGDVITVSGLTTFNAASATVLAVPSATTFVLSSETVGTAETGTGSIVGFIYYTTDPAHGLSVTDRQVSISGLSTAAFNLSLAPVYRVASSTVFLLASTATGTAVTGATGVLTATTQTNATTTITGNARVQPVQVVQTRATATAKATLSFPGMSGALGSSRVQRPGGLPTGFKNSQSTYTRLPQSAGW
jgi:hypothetical protein